jgi:arsenite methyltransferase
MELMALPAHAVPPTHLKSCCADLWSHPGVRLLVGDVLHPGGERLTGLALDLMGLMAGDWVLDVGAGPGTTVRVARARGLRAVGVDLSVRWAPTDLPLAGGDAERLPFRDGAFRGVLAECVVSLLPRKSAAVAEFRRVLQPRGRVAISDVTVDGLLPEALATFAGWVACVGGALPLAGYVDLLSGCGLSVEHVEDHRRELEALIAKARRRLSLVQGAARAGLVSLDPVGIPKQLLDLGGRLLEVASEAVRDGAVGYALIVASA